MRDTNQTFFILIDPDPKILRKTEFQISFWFFYHFKLSENIGRIQDPDVRFFMVQQNHMDPAESGNATMQKISNKSQLLTGEIEFGIAGLISASKSTAVRANGD